MAWSKRGLFSVVFWFILLIGGKDQVVFAQQYNPFELENRLEQKVQAGERVSFSGDNPFDIRYTMPSDILILKEKREAELKKTFLNKKRKETNLEFWICFSIIFLFAIVFSVYRTFVLMALRSVFNKNLLANLFRDRRIFRTPLRLYYLIYLFSISFFIARVGRHYYDISLEAPQYLQIFLVVSALIFLKHLVVAVINFLIPTKQNHFAVYNFLIVIFGILLGIFLLPWNMISTLENTYGGDYIIYLLIAIVSAVLFLRYIRGIVLFRRYLPLYFFQFFIYLCTVEIAPLLLIRNYFLSN